MKTRKMLSILLTLTMALGLLAFLPITARAAAPANPDGTNIWDFRFVDANGGGTGWAWDQSTKTLTLTNFSYSSSARSVLELPANAAIILNGTNTLTLSSGEEGFVINVRGDLTIGGTGSLIASGGIGISTYNGHPSNSGSLTITGGTVTAIGTNRAIFAPYTVPNGCRYWQSTTTTDPGGAGTVSSGTVNANSFQKFFKVEYAELPGYSVTYDLNWGNGPHPSEPNHEAGQTFAAASAAGLSMTNYLFKQWNTKSNGTGTGYAPDTAITMPANNLTLYAVWEGVPHTVTYDRNGGEGTAPAPQIVPYFADFAVASPTGIAAPKGKQFKEWNTKSDGTGYAYTPDMLSTVIGDLTLYAIWKDAIPYLLTVVNGSGGALYTVGTLVSIHADTPPAGKVFDKWTCNGGTLADANNASTTFTMPDGNVTVTAVFKNIPYALTVINGSGSEHYTMGTLVSINANTPPEGKVFDKWTTGSGVTFADAYSASTTFTMPDNAVTVTANYKDAPNPPKGIFGTNAKWYGAWWHYLLFFLGFGFIWMWF